jgi:cellulose synthase/poly-beta-1,6-N-acetylglucosamine synthase-like glycosyltransferase
MSAYRTLSRAQTAALVITGTVAVVCAVGNPLWFFIGINAIATTLYVVAFVYNLAWFRKLLARPGIVSVGDEEARSVPDEELPRYTVLVAAYKEADVIARTIRTLEALDYPRDRLEIKLLLESDDAATIAAVGRARPAPQFEVVVVPQAEPRTKPKACNYGLQASSGELITIFDAEDRPEPLQLRRAAVAFRRLDPAIACLQAKLHYYNADQNLITRWFSAEYVTWFSGMLPALVEMKAPIPLGGTSMHIRREVLEAVGAWDPYNVTEDADLGTRLHRLGFRTEVLDSVTYEEANSDLINWVKQRSRWYKGYLQTWLVHLRHPLKLWRQLGPVGFLGFNVVVGGTPVLALLNPFFWLLACLWFVGRLEFIQAIFPGWLYYAAMLCMILGNFVAAYRTLVSIRLAGRPELLPSLLLYPAYWVMMSVAAVRAFVQLLVAPWVWEKTTHGLDQHVGAEAQIADD